MLWFVWSALPFSAVLFLDLTRCNMMIITAVKAYKSGFKWLIDDY